MDHDGDLLNEVVLPLLNVQRRTAAGLINPHEPHQAQCFMTSAGQKNSYAYSKLIEMFEKQIIDPKSTFVWSTDYRVPMMHGLLTKEYLNDIKLSQTYKDETFAREYMSLWTGGGDDSWFDYDRLSSYRTIQNPEKVQNFRGQTNIFYLISVDVGRLSCQTVATIFKVRQRDDSFYISIPNIFVLGLREETKHFSIQASQLKQLIAQFGPKEVVIDGNGLGVGLLDFMVQETTYNGVTYPPYVSFNDPDYGRRIYKEGQDLIYVIKSNSTLDAKIHSNCFTKISSGKVRFLEKEQIVKNKLLQTQVGQKMKLEKRVERLLPHELTSRLIEEMVNLRLRPTGQSSEIKLEQINTNLGKDKFSSLEYGLWRLKEIEEEYYKKRSRKGSKRRVLSFYTQGGANGA